MSDRFWVTAKAELDEALHRVCKASAALSNSQPSPGEPGAAEWYECNRLIRHLETLMAKVTVRVSIAERRAIATSGKVPGR